jgi:hypothetical protein
MMSSGLKLLGLLALAAAVGVASVSQATVISYLSNNGTVDLLLGPNPGDGAVQNLEVGAVETGSMYIWLRNDQTLQSVAYNIAAATPGVIEFTGAEVYQYDLLVGGVVDIGDRWNLPLSTGTFGPGNQSIINMAAVNVNASGLNPTTRAFDAGYEAATNAALFARINFKAIGAGSTLINLSMGDTLIVENGVVPSTEFFGGLVNVTGGVVIDPPVVDDFEWTTTELGEIVSTTMTASNDPTSWSGLTFEGFTPLLPGKVGGPVNDPSWDPNTQAFSWDTSGSFRGTYQWSVIASNEGGDSAPGLITIHVTVPEPATLSLFGLALVGIVGLTRRRS